MMSQTKRRDAEERLGQTLGSGGGGGGGAAGGGGLGGGGSSKRARKKRARAAADLEEERRLTALLFGGGAGGGPFGTVDGGGELFASAGEGIVATGNRRSLSTGAAVGDGDIDPSGQPLFEIDRSGDSNAPNLNVQGLGSDEASDEDKDEADQRLSENDDANEAEDPKQAAWVDEDDDGLRVNLLESASRLRKLRRSRAEDAPVRGTDLEARLRARFLSTAELTARTDWAQWSDRDDAADGDERGALDANESSSLSLFGETHFGGRRLPAGIIKMVRCTDANQTDPNQSVVQAVHFHPASDAENPLLLTAGLDKTLRFFQVGVEKSTKVHGIHCKCCCDGKRPASYSRTRELTPSC
jgi:hypothetical protein